MDNKEEFEDINYLPPPPNAFGITLYGKSNCTRCDELKDMLETSNMLFKYENCDRFLEADKEKFKDIMFEYMKVIPPKRVLYFPICFVDGIYFSSINKLLYIA